MLLTLLFLPPLASMKVARKLIDSLETASDLDLSELKIARYHAMRHVPMRCMHSYMHAPCMMRIPCMHDPMGACMIPWALTASGTLHATDVHPRAPLIIVPDCCSPQGTGVRSLPTAATHQSMGRPTRRATLPCNKWSKLPRLFTSLSLVGKVIDFL